VKVVKEVKGVNGVQEVNWAKLAQETTRGLYTKFNLNQLE